MENRYNKYQPQMSQFYEAVGNFWASQGKKVPIHDISEGRSERVKINGKYPERDFDLEKGENLLDNDYSD